MLGSQNNMIAIIGVLTLTLIYIAYRTIKDSKNLIVEGTAFESNITRAKLGKYVNEVFALSQKASINDMNLTSEQYKRQQSNREELKESQWKAGEGDREAKNFMIRFTQDIITRPQVGITPTNIDDIVPFTDADRMSSRDKTETLIFLWLRDYGPKGFSKMFSEYKLDAPKRTPYGKSYVVTDEDIDAVYRDYIEKRGGIAYKEKIRLLACFIYEDIIGNGAIELLQETDVDDVQFGISGIPAESYDIINTEKRDDMSYSFESVWIVYHGLNIHLKCTTLGSQSELMRITRNVYRYKAPSNLSINNPNVIGSTKAGSRVMVAMPPFADSYVGIVRKFDSSPSADMSVLLRPEKKNEQSEEAV